MPHHGAAVKIACTPNGEGWHNKSQGDMPQSASCASRYASKEAWRDIHEKSSAYLEFVGKRNRSEFTSVSRDVVFCVETEHGFAQRA